MEKTLRVRQKPRPPIYGFGAFSFPCDIVPSKLSVGSLLRSVGIELADNYVGMDGALERLIDYMELVREFDQNKLFVLVNLRSFFEDKAVCRFMETILSHEYRVFLLDNREYAPLPLEKRVIVDDDLCEI